jgi:hypothetical protein
VQDNANGLMQCMEDVFGTFAGGAVTAQVPGPTRSTASCDDTRSATGLLSGDCAHHGRAADLRVNPPSAAEPHAPVASMSLQPHAMMEPLHGALGGAPQAYTQLPSQLPSFPVQMYSAANIPMQERSPPARRRPAHSHDRTAAHVPAIAAAPHLLHILGRSF